MSLFSSSEDAKQSCLRTPHGPENLPAHLRVSHCCAGVVKAVENENIILERDGRNVYKNYKSEFTVTLALLLVIRSHAVSI